MEPIRILSLGAGVQSSTLALMIAKGEIEPVTCAIFADTGWEPKKVYEWLDWLEKQLPYPVYRVQKGDLRQDTIQRSNTSGKRVAAIPWHMKLPNGDRAMGRRQCTLEYKISPLTKKAREIVGLSKGQRAKGIVCEMLIGISTDEALRMKPAREAWKRHRWPLIEKGMTRSDCLIWMERHAYPRPPKSSCIGCPFHSDFEWRLIRQNKEEWDDAVKIDQIIRNQPGIRGEQFMHRSCLPLDQVDLSTAADHGQTDMFNNECEGMCGV
jgi:hypothetical protein